jgi:organic radical activating enzyme
MKIKCQCGCCRIENNKNNVAKNGLMGKNGLHYLAYSLTLDPEQEILGAIEEVSNSAGLEKIVKEAPAKGIEAAVEDAPVIYQDNSASYRSEAAELPSNYKDSGYKAAQDDDDKVDVNYNTDVIIEEKAKEYVKEIDTQIFANTLGFNEERSYSSLNEKQQAEFYKMSLGFGVRFLLYTMRALTF